MTLYVTRKVYYVQCLKDLEKTGTDPSFFSKSPQWLRNNSGIEVKILGKIRVYYTPKALNCLDPPMGKIANQLSLNEFTFLFPKTVKNTVHKHACTFSEIL